MSSWWARQLSGIDLPPMGPGPSQQPPPPRNYPQTPSAPAPHRAASARNTDTCPDCGSGNYLGTGETRKRCYDCGYPLVQSGTNAVATESKTPAQQARQAPSQGYHPEIIVGRIDH